MREIKFRAWDPLENKMLYSKKGLIVLPADNIYSTSTFVILKHWMGDVCHESHAIGYQRGEIMQYTGLKDINGIEIYERDIIEKINQKSKYFVEWCDKGWWIRGVSNSNHYSVWNSVWNSVGYKVIGNIYENPELLEVK